MEALLFVIIKEYKMGTIRYTKGQMKNILTLADNYAKNNTKTKDLINFMKKLIIKTLYNELFVKYLSAAKSIGYNLWANLHKEC